MAGDKTPLSDADAALLGLLCEEPQHPWQIEKTVQERDMRFWTDLSQSTIYKQLRSLEKSKYVQCDQQVGDGRLRKVYSITKAGRSALVTRLQALLSEPQHLKYRVDLATYNIDLLPKNKAIAALKTYRSKLLEGIDCYKKVEEYMRSCQCTDHRLAVARRPVFLLEGEVKWVDEFLKEVEAG